MVKTKGAIDRVPFRKGRSDAGKKRKTYRGKPVVGRKKQRKYNNKIGNKDTLWLRAYWRVPMSRDGYNNWQPWLKGKLWKEVTNMKSSPTFRDTPIELINTKEKIIKFFEDRLWYDKKLGGKFVIMGGGNGKTKISSNNPNGFKPYPMFTILITETKDGNVGRIIKNHRLSKYRWMMKD